MWCDIEIGIFSFPLLLFSPSSANTISQLSRLCLLTPSASVWKLCGKSPFFVVQQFLCCSIFKIIMYIREPPFQTCDFAGTSKTFRVYHLFSGKEKRPSSKSDWHCWTRIIYTICYAYLFVETHSPCAKVNKILISPLARSFTQSLLLQLRNFLNGTCKKMFSHMKRKC